jgi:NAD(P)-dependent dehydrogenase (short-subunit alcohol dehydrogenase family)
MPNVAEAPVFPLLQGKVAVITGSAQGMGKTTAEVFLKAGAKVVITDIQEDKGQDVAKELAALGDVTFVKCDISKSTDVQQLIAKIVETYGRLDCAVNNAGATPDSTPFVEFDEDYWNKVINISLTGTALCCKYEMQQMIKDGVKGSIVNIASINAFRPQPNMPAYTSAKHALIGLTKHAASEGGPHGIRVNAIAPGAIYVSEKQPHHPIIIIITCSHHADVQQSDMSAAALEIMNTTEEEFSKKCSYLHRFGMPHEVAQGSLWLCSDTSSFVVGVCLPIDGGYLAM